MRECSLPYVQARVSCIEYVDGHVSEHVYRHADGHVITPGVWGLACMRERAGMTPEDPDRCV